MFATNPRSLLAILALPLMVACTSDEDKESAGSDTAEVVDGSGSGSEGSEGGGEGSGSGSGSEGGGEGSGSGGEGASGGSSGAGTGDEGSTGTTDTGGSGGSGDDGGPTMDVTAEELVGRTWQLELSAANVSDPALLGSVLTSLFTDSMFLGVSAASATSLDMAVAVGTPDGAGFQLGTILALGSSDFSTAPALEVDGTGSTLFYRYGGVDIPFEDPLFVGMMATDGSQLDTMEFSARIDTRELGPLFDLGSSPDAVCELADTFGTACEPCSDGASVCLSFVADWTNAPLIEGISLE